MRAAGAAAIALLLALAPGAAEAQTYKTVQWLNFEDGKLPADATPFGHRREEAVRVVETEKLSGMPSEFFAGTAAAEIGRYCLEFAPDPVTTNATTHLVGLAAAKVLDRRLLGERGCALFQMDVFIPPTGRRVPSIAIVAMDPIQPNMMNRGPQNFTRFGIMSNSKVFSSQLITVPERRPSKLAQDQAMFGMLPRPGWHRFAIEYRGQREYRVFIDGREPHFSPLEDDAQPVVQLGVISAELYRGVRVYVDNLSIQYSADANELPRSPWQAGWKLAQGQKVPPPVAGAAEAAPSAATAASLSAQAEAALADTNNAAGGGWVQPAAAWKQAQAQQRNMLLYFYAPGMQNSQRLDELFSSDPAARPWVRRYVRARIDVNQLAGSELATRYGVTQVPCVMVVTPKAEEVGRAVFMANDTWAIFHARMGAP